VAATATARKSGYQMSDEHKENLAIGREQSRVVKNYLTALEAHQPRRGRKRTPESVTKRLDSINSQLAKDIDPLTRLQALSERAILERELDRLSVDDDITELEKAFIEVAGQYGERKGIPYAAWRSVGVPSNVLKQAGIQRSA
jgi:hypothetical protein